MRALALTDRDLSFERWLAVPPSHLWTGWTNANILMKWFTPAPWVTEEAEIEPVLGGIFRTVMTGPNGERNEGTGTVLEAIENQSFIWTSCLQPGLLPTEPPEHGFVFTAIIEMEPDGNDTHYRAVVRHANASDAKQHDEMGFEAGWGAALDQLVALYSV